MGTSMKRIILAGALLSLTTLSSHSAGMSVGSKSIGVKLSSASIGREDYTILGLSGNYFVIDNLSIGAAYEYWFSGSPSISKLTVESTYFIPLAEKIKPYAGILASRYFVGDGFDDSNSHGFRAGLAFINSPVILSAGIKREYFSEDKGVFSGDSTTYEVVIGFSI